MCVCVCVPQATHHPACPYVPFSPSRTPPNPPCVRALMRRRVVMRGGWGRGEGRKRERVCVCVCVRERERERARARARARVLNGAVTRLKIESKRERERE